MLRNAMENFRHFSRQIEVPEEGCKGTLQTKNCFSQHATGGPPGVIQRSRSRGISRQRRNP